MVGVQYPHRISLKELPAASKSLSVRGTIEFLLPQEAYTLDLESRAGDVTAEGIRATAAIDSAGAVQVTCTILQPDQPHIRPRPEDFRLKNSDGTLLDAVATRTGPPHAPVQNWKWDAPAGSKPSHVRVRFFKSVGVLAVPFEFKDLPLR